ncbi:MAG TPA: DNA polymerase/3'-5' exonuclease PolX [Gammaproteobacteria bacterium]|nr:DNA polymerase/3'-5' exonuclease PolX [Gammaproteobacteria bacterium]
MPLHNADIARIFEEIADLLEIQNANPFRIRAYRNAARTVRDLPTEVAALVAGGRDLTRLPGIGQDLAGQIAELVRTGMSAKLAQLRKQTPAGLSGLMQVPDLGPKRVQALYQHLHIRTTAQLKKAAQSGKLRRLPGFGAKTEQRILEALGGPRHKARRWLLAVARQYADGLLTHLAAARGLEQAVVAGSFRRCKETVGDLDILVSAAPDNDVMARFVGYDEVKRVLSRGQTRSTVVLRAGLQVDLRLIEPASFGAALHYFTGSRAHNIAVRKLGQQAGLKINEYGVFRGTKRIAGATEAAVFQSVGLPYIPPELREDRGEIEAARAGRLPQLVRLDDIKGDLHAHSKATDGHHSIEEMARAAKAAGLSYLAITDHSRHLTVAKGLDPARLLRQMDEIDALNERLRGITVLKGIEVDILEDGSLDLPDALLRRLDVVVGAVHSRFRLSRNKQTERILRALRHPCLTLLAHPSGRLLGQRPAYEVNMEAIIHTAAEEGCFLELNAHPERLDLDDIHCKMAREAGVLLSLNSDAHSNTDFRNMIWAVGQARRGWLEAKDVLNTRTLGTLRKLLKKH